MMTLIAAMMMMTINVGEYVKQVNIIMFERTRLIVNKITEACNCKCKYCSASSNLNIRNSMKLSTFKKAVDFILQRTIQTKVTWLFQGGEPLLVPFDWYQEGVAYAKQVASKYNKRIKFAITTNGTNINTKIVEFLKSEKFIIGVSLDGPPEIHDSYRSHGNQALCGINELKNEGLNFRIICMITPKNWNIMNKVISFFVENQLYYTRINLFYQAGRGLECKLINYRQALQAKIDILHYMLKNNDQFTEINTIHQVLDYFDFHHPSTGPVCSTIHCAAANGFLGITFDGTVYPCGRTSDIGNKYALWNINDRFEETRIAEKVNTLHANSGIYAKCLRCNASKICEYSCLAYMEASYKNFELDCNVTKGFYKYLQKLTGRKKQLLLKKMAWAHQQLPRSLGN